MSRGEGLKSSERIIVLRLSSIGDLILISPLLRALRRQFPQAKLDLVTKEAFAELVRFNPNLSDIHLVRPEEGFAGLSRLGMKLRAANYDTVLDLHRNFRTSWLLQLIRPRSILRYRKHRVRRWLYVKFKTKTMQGVPPVYARYLAAAHSLGVGEDGNGLELFWRSEHEQQAEQALLQLGWIPGMPLVALAPGAGFFTKRWPIEHFAELASQILERFAYIGIAIVGGRNETGLGRQISEYVNQPQRSGGRVFDLTGKCSLLTSAVVIQRSRLLVTNDSGPMHMAEAVRTPLIMLAGSTTRELGFFPQSPTSRVLEVDLPCRPCSHLGRQACPLGHFRCMREIAPELVAAEVENVLRQVAVGSRQ